MKRQRVVVHVLAEQQKGQHAAVGQVQEAHRRQALHRRVLGRPDVQVGGAGLGPGAASVARFEHQLVVGTGQHGDQAPSRGEVHARRRPGARHLAQAEGLQLRPGAAVVGGTGQERLRVCGHGGRGVVLHVHEHQQLPVVEALHVDRLLPVPGSGRQRVPPVGGVLEPGAPDRRGGLPLYVDVAELRLPEQVGTYGAGAAVGGVARLEAAVVADPDGEAVALQGDLAAQPDAVGARHARNHLQLDELEVAGVVHLRQRYPEVLGARRLTAVWEVHEIEVVLVAGAQDDAGVAVAAQQEVEADPAVLEGAGPVEREVRPLQRGDLGVQQTGRNRQRAVAAVGPDAVDEVPARAVADREWSGGGHARSVCQAAARAQDEIGEFIGRSLPPAAARARAPPHPPAGRGTARTGCCSRRRNRSLPHACGCPTARKRSEVRRRWS